MADLEQLRARLNALRAKTVANGCTEDEAMAAAEKFAELLTRHGLTEEELRASEYDDLEILVGRRSPLQSVWGAVAAFADCKGWFVTRPSGNHWVYFGLAGDVLVAEYVHSVVHSACKRAIAEFKKTPTYERRRTRKTKAAALRAFQEALAASLVRKLREGLWRRYIAGQTPEAARNALALRKAELGAAAEASGFKLQTLRPLMKAEGKFRDEARHSGFEAGAGIEVNAAVAAGTKVAGLLA